MTVRSTGYFRTPMVVVLRKRISSKQGTFAASAITRSSQAGRFFFMKQGRKWTSRAPAFSSSSIALPSVSPVESSMLHSIT